MNGDSGNRTPETMANRSPDDRCVWTRMPDDEQRWMQPVRFYLACADEIARGRYPFYPDNCPQCGKPVVIHSENGEPVKSEAVTSNEQLYTCSCAEYYGSHHPECPARQQFDRQRAEIERLRQYEPLTDAQCDDVIAFLEDYEWTGLTRENVRTWCTAIACARFEVERLTGELDEARKPPHCPTCGGGR